MSDGKRSHEMQLTDEMTENKKTLFFLNNRSFPLLGSVIYDSSMNARRSFFISSNDIGNISRV